MSSQADSSSSGNYYRPEAKLDADLQRELDEALGDLSIEEIVDAEEAAIKGAAPQAPAGASAGARTGTVIAVQGDDIFVNLGGRSEGVLPAGQFADEPLPNVGDSVNVTIEGYDRADGLLVLSREGAVTAAAWETIEEGQIVEGRVIGVNKGGLELTINGIRAFMPISQIELYRLEDLSPYLNQRLKCQVTEVDRAEQNVIVSRRAVLELEAAAAREQAWEQIEEGQVVSGVVRNIMPYGAFVSIGAIDGLLHVKDMSYSRVEDPRTIVQEGQKLQVKVLKVDREARRVGLGLKQVMPDPWTGAAEKWPADGVVTGRVTRLADFGAFVELESGVEGLIPIGEMTFERRIKHPGEIVSAGQVVKARVLSVDEARKRISLSLKRVGDDPWMGASARWKPGSIVDGVVKRLADFGAFVELAPGVEGLVHISELSGDRVRAVGDVVQEGQVVQAKVLEADEDRRRISLSIKQLAGVADYTGPAAIQAEAEPQGRAKPKRKKPLKGGLD